MTGPWESVMVQRMKARDLFDWPDGLPFRDHFDPDVPPWEWLSRIEQALGAFDFESAAGKLDIPANVDLSGDVYLHPSVRFIGACTILGPAWIGPGVEIRPGAFVRGNVIVGEGSCLGNSCEYKNCLLLEKVETPHYNYVGDSILGNKAHLGAGAICANLKLARDEVVIRIGTERFPTGRRKVGALLGDGAEAGCNSVLQPGTILGKGSAVLCTSFSGYLPPDKMAVQARGYKVIPRRS